MCRKTKEFQTLSRGNPAKANPKLSKLRMELAQIEAEIEKLVDSLTGANAVLLSYANSKAEELDAGRRLLVKQISDLSIETVSPKQMEHISGYLQNWGEVSFDDRRLVVDGIITMIKATQGNIEIGWKI